MTENEKLRHLIKISGITRRTAAQLIENPIDNIHAWLRPTDNKAHRAAPHCCVELLRMKLIDRRKIPVDVYNQPLPPVPTTTEKTTMYTIYNIEATDMGTDQAEIASWVLSQVENNQYANKDDFDEYLWITAACNALGWYSIPQTGGLLVEWEEVENPPVPKK